MIVVVESGATKAHWVFLEGHSVVKHLYTAGLNPNAVSLGQMRKEIAVVQMQAKELPAHLKIFFYGAGCLGEEGAQKLHSALKNHFPDAAISVKSDLVAAGIALYGKGSGVVSILGTGSSCCYYRNGAIQYVAPSLGYLLGDEGGGFSLGKELLNRYAYGLLPLELTEMFAAAFPSDSLVAELYKSPSPAGYLAQFVPFMVNNFQHPYVKQLVKEAFERYIQRQVVPVCTKCGTASIGVVGSVGVLFSTILEPVAAQYGLCVDGFVQYPIDALIQYHSS